MDETRRLPHGSELMRLPDRVVAMAEDPYDPGQPLFPVAAFNSPGYIITHTCAYEEMAAADYPPLFSCGAVGWYGDSFRSAAIRVDDEPRRDLRCMPSLVCVWLL